MVLVFLDFVREIEENSRESYGTTNNQQKRNNQANLGHPGSNFLVQLYVNYTTVCLSYYCLFLKNCQTENKYKIGLAILGPSVRPVRRLARRLVRRLARESIRKKKKNVDFKKFPRLWAKIPGFLT